MAGHVPKAALKRTHSKRFARFVSDRLWDANDRKRLYHEAVDFMKLRAQRRKLSRKGMDKKTVIAVPSLETVASGGSGNEAHRA